MKLAYRVKAYLPVQTGQDKAKYVPIGVVFLNERDQLVLKLDALPLPNVVWDGWCNLFPPEESGQD